MSVSTTCMFALLTWRFTLDTITSVEELSPAAYGVGFVICRHCPNMFSHAHRAMVMMHSSLGSVGVF